MTNPNTPVTLARLLLFRLLPFRSSMSIVRFIKTYKWAIVLVLVAAFLFYWYEIRPIQVYRGCARQASLDARSLLRSKAEIAKGTDKGKAYDELIKKNMYLRSDYESFLQKCLMHYGRPLPEKTTNGTAASSASSQKP